MRPHLLTVYSDGSKLTVVTCYTVAKQLASQVTMQNTHATQLLHCMVPPMLHSDYDFAKLMFFFLGFFHILPVYLDHILYPLLREEVSWRWIDLFSTGHFFLSLSLSLSLSLTHWLNHWLTNATLRISRHHNKKTLNQRLKSFWQSALPHLLRPQPLILPSPSVC